MHCGGDYSAEAGSVAGRLEESTQILQNGAGSVAVISACAIFAQAKKYYLVRPDR